MSKLDKQFNEATNLSVKQVARLAILVYEVLSKNDITAFEDDLVAENIHTSIYGKMFSDPRKVAISQVWELPEGEA